MAWNILFYESGGQTPVESFIKSLSPSTSAKLIRNLDLLQEFGPRLSMPIGKPIGKGMYELRVRGKQEVRVLYIFAKGKNIYLLHAFLKKTRAIPKKELELASSRKAVVDRL